MGGRFPLEVAMYKHILIPIDGSSLAKSGLEQALALARELGASVTVLTVYSPFQMPSMETVQLENLTVRSFEHVAIASGISHARGFARKQPFRHRYNFTHVWVRRVMHWELVGGHISVAS